MPNALTAALEQAWYDAELHARSSKVDGAIVVLRHMRDLALLRATATEHAGSLVRFDVEDG